MLNGWPPDEQLPTRLWKVANASCGMEVMATRRAISAPMPPPSIFCQDQADGQRVEPGAKQPQRVVTTAMPIPIMPLRLPPGWWSARTNP